MDGWKLGTRGDTKNTHALSNHVSNVLTWSSDLT